MITPTSTENEYYILDHQSVFITIFWVHFFEKVYIVNREVEDVTLREEIMNLKLENQLQRIQSPDGAPPGVFIQSISKCPTKTFDKFNDFLDIELKESPNKSTEFNDSNEQSKRKKKTPLTMTKKSKKIGKLKQLKNVTKTKTDWLKSPVFDTNGFSPREYINAYWRSNGDNRPQRYGYEYNKTLFKDEVKKMNISKLWNPLESTYDTNPIDGVNRTMILVGGEHTSFSWHNEDMDLASINYMHFGADKYWLAVHRGKPTRDFREKLIESFAPFEDKKCSNPIKHKLYQTSLEWLDKNNIEYSIVSIKMN